MDIKSNLWRTYLVKTVTMLVYQASRENESYFIDVTPEGRITFGKNTAGFPNNVRISEYDNTQGDTDAERITLICMEVIDKLNSAVVKHVYTVPTPLTDEEKQLALNGNKIGAIKEIRARTGLGLRDSKDSLDAWCGTLSYQDQAQAMRLAADRNNQK